MPRTTAGIIRLLFGIQLISMGAMEMSGPFWPVLLRALGSSDLVFGASSVAVYIGPMIGIALTGAFWGRVGDCYGHKLMMLRALISLSVTQLALAYADDVLAIVVLRFLQGACAGFIAPSQAYGAAVVVNERRGRLFALLQVSTNAGALLGAVLGGLILDHASFFWINIGASLLCAGCAVATAVLLPPLAPTPRPESGTASPPAKASIWRNPLIVGLLCAHGCLLLSRLMPQMSFALYVGDVFEVDHWVTGLCYGLFATGFMACASLWARFFEQRSQSRALEAIGYVALTCAVVVAITGATKSIAVFAAGYFLWGGLLGATSPVLTSLISCQLTQQHQGYILGIVQSVTQISSITGVLIGGIVNQSIGMHYVFPSVVLMYILSFVVIITARRFAFPQAHEPLRERST